MAVSLILTHRIEGRRVLVIGDHASAASRIGAVRDAGGEPIVAWLESESTNRAVDPAILYPSDVSAAEAGWAALLDEVDVDASLVFVCITDTLATRAGDLRAAALRRCHILAELCRKRRIPLNVTDNPQLCDFSFPATHRFNAGDSPSSLQVAVTTNGRGCRLAARIRRQIIEELPADIGTAVERIGEMRDMCKRSNDTECSEDDPRLTGGSLGYAAAPDTDPRRRMQWIAQISEYWPLEHLASLSYDQILKLLKSPEIAPSDDRPQKRSKHELDITPAKPSSGGHIYLLGAGPGHPGLLTVAACHLLTSKSTDLVLSDKLVPAQVIELIPRNTPLVIAKKFPGNAEGAQSELITQALEAAQQGKVVVRLKQGDPFVYGRGGEELLACKKAGIPCTVVPGISSALAGPLMFDVPVTQRGASDSMVLCTGVGRGGSRVSIVGYERGRTLLILMGTARLRAVVDTLVQPHVESGARSGAPYPKCVPIAVVERASSGDQRMIASTLDRIVEVIEQRLPDGPRPPSMLLVGWSLLSLAGDVPGNGVLDDAARDDLHELDAQRVARWLGEDGYSITEGLPSGYALLDTLVPVPDTQGWAPPRYDSKGPVGGWTPGERSTLPSRE